jgi:hypothetical protein
MCKVYTELREKDKEYDEEVKKQNKEKAEAPKKAPMIVELD